MCAAVCDFQEALVSAGEMTPFGTVLMHPTRDNVRRYRYP